MQWTVPTTGIAMCQSAVAVVERRESRLGYQLPNRSPLLDGRFAIRKPTFASTIMNDPSGPFPDIDESPFLGQGKIRKMPKRFAHIRPQRIAR